MDEKWIAIEGFENYIISNTGKVKNVVKNTEIKGSDNGNGYLKIQFYKNGKIQRKYIHRLVAQHFLPNPEGKLFVNHIDCNPSNNCVENLEWCTHKENMAWMVEKGRNQRTEEWKRNHEKGLSRLYVGVIGENIKTGEKIYFSKLNDVKKAGFQPSCVCYCCKGKRGVTQHKGYRWEYEKAI